MTNKESIQNKSELLFLYESSYSIPNGDPFTGEQRYDEETKKILVSDVRIKRFIRDYFLELNHTLPREKQFEIYVWNDLSAAEGKESGASARVKSLKKKYANDPDVKIKKKIEKEEKEIIDAEKLLKKCIDVRLFGGISTEKRDNVNLTGPVQFALLNPSLNQIDLRMHQNTSVFVSSVEKTQGSIGTTTVVPYSLIQIHGWINPYSAKHTDLTDNDVKMMCKALWESINNANTRSKSNQNSLLLLQIIYQNPTDKIYGIDRLIKINPNDNKRDEQIRSLEDFKFDFAKLFDAITSEKIEKIRYYSEIDEIKRQFEKKEKFEEMKFKENNKEQK